MFEHYDEHRVEGAKTLGDAYKAYKRSPTAFVAGVQYAFDKLLHEENFVVNHPRFGDCMSPEMAETLAIDILEKAKKGEPQ